MLKSLKIRDLAIIDKIEMEFGPGLTMITGETGAGKSIIIGAISLILGERASSNVVRSNCDSATVEAIFDIKRNSAVTEKLDRYGIDNDGEMIVRRVISKTGKNRIYINGTYVTLSMLHDLTSELIDISSQHQYHSLMKPRRQLDFYDTHLNNLALLHRYQTSLKELNNLKKELEGLLSSESEAIHKADYLRFVVQEIQSMKPSEEEDTELESRKGKLASARALNELTETFQAAMTDDEYAVKRRLEILSGKAGNFLKIDPSFFGDIRTRLESLSAELEDISASMRDYGSTIETDPEALYDIEERLDTINRLKHKYGGSIQSVLERLDEATLELETIENRDSILTDKMNTFRKTAQQLEAFSTQLSHSRKSGRKSFEKNVGKELRDLNLPSDGLHVEIKSDTSVLIPDTFTKKDLDTLTRAFKSTGTDKIRFLLKPNTGEAPRDLTKIVSGGELSRILLAIKNLSCGKNQVGIYLFDEVDSGIGGAVAEMTGKKLKRISGENQVICITHLPQIASFAKHHFKVSKKVQSGRTITRIDPLSKKSRIEEIARMLGGTKITKKTRDHATEMLSASL